MSTHTATPTALKAMATFRRFTGAEYDRMVETGILTDEDEVELLEGQLVLKMPRGERHDGSLNALNDYFVRLRPPGWVVRGQSGSKLADSRPEPDLAFARGDFRTYFTRHPAPADLGLVVEVSDSSLDRDQQDKFRIYARDRIPVYWVVNLVDRRVEVYTDPSGPGDDPCYHTRRVFPAGAAVPVELDGAAVGTVPVNDLLP